MRGPNEAQLLESFIIKQLLKTSGVFKGTEAAGSSLTADMFADTLSEAIAGGGGFGLEKLVRPLPDPLPPGEREAPAVTSAFGARIDPINGQLSRHTGVDLAAAEGTPIPAAMDGVVIAAGERGGYGNAIEVAHPDGTSTLYAHASGVAVHPGDRVGAGDVLGWIGQTGRTTGPHLHLEVRKAGQFLDPGQALKAYRLRADDKAGGSP
ncbi:MAG: M23 family metallopeptidase [Archangium sp.]|nr:M23 family metallopeptidase [Archangium sp.]